MMQLVNLAVERFDKYYYSFSNLSSDHKRNFEIKYDHSFRVAEMCRLLASRLDWSEQEQNLAYIAGLFHDIGRFQQLIEYDTFSDTKSVDHAEYSLKVLHDEDLLDNLAEGQKSAILAAIKFHNKRELPRDLDGQERKYASLLRDADKLDILKVITDYYTKPKTTPNHTLTWELPTGTAVTPAVAKQVLTGQLVAKELVSTQLDIKVMQLSWVFDLNFKPSYQLLMEKRFLEKIYETMPKSDTVIQIYRSVKIFSGNKVMS